MIIVVRAALATALFSVISPINSLAANAQEQFEALKQLNVKFEACAAVAAIEHNYNPAERHEKNYTFFHKAALILGERTSIDSSGTEQNIQKAALTMNQIRELSPERFSNALLNCDKLANAFPQN